MAVTCKNCGGAHPTWECRRPAKESTAARKDVRGPSNRETVPRVPLSRPGDDPVSVYQAAPVDTPKRGRPRIHPDRKAYLAMKARERRAKLKEAQP